MPDNFVVPMSEADSFLRQKPESRAWQQFNTAFLELLQPHNPAAFSLGTFLRRTLLVFHRLGFHSEMEVLSEVYIRAHRLIHDEFAEIRNPSHWVRKTAHNVIREWSRKGRRDDSLPQDVVDEQEENRNQRLVVEVDVTILDKAWQALTSEEQRLLTLKITKNHSWREVAAIYAMEGKPIAESALRQQKARALKHLRRLYHALRPLTDIKAEELTTRQPQRQLNYPLTVDMPLATSIKFVASYCLQFISKSGTPNNFGQVHRHKFVYLTEFVTSG
jgi:RNA polymerase sigma factor (sigma-70 family)